MSALSPAVGQSLAALYDHVRRKVHAFVEPLSTEQLWSRPFPFGNSVGHLLLHLTGNLNYYVGTQIAGSGYVRDRPREFTDTSHRDKDEVLRDFDRALDMVLATLAAQQEADWRAPYSAVGAEDIADRLGIFVRCASHADHHAGQMIYLGKQIGREATVAYSVAPMLSVRHGAQAVEFYKSAFGAVEVYRVEDPGGTVVSRLSVEGAEFWVADESPEHHNHSPESLGGGSVRMILTVPDPDSMVARARAAGAREVVAVAEAYGWRLGRVVDPFGHHWEIGRPLAT